MTDRRLSLLRTIRLLLASTVVSAPFASCALARGDDVAFRVAEPPVPTSLAGKGTVYHTIAERQAQLTFTSHAPLQDIVGKSNAVVGYAVAGPRDAPAELVGGRWILPVASLATGIPSRDEHLAGERWLDAAAHPTIEFTLERTEDIELVKSGADFTTWTATLVGTLELHGVRKPLRVEKAKLSFLAASGRTAKIARGDLLFLQCAYEVKLSDLAVANADIPGKVADTIRLDQILRMSTIAFGTGADPATPP
jgi:polyisoprenoid-binding protein YceI